MPRPSTTAPAITPHRNCPSEIATDTNIHVTCGTRETRDEKSLTGHTTIVVNRGTGAQRVHQITDARRCDGARCTCVRRGSRDRARERLADELEREGPPLRRARAREARGQARDEAAGRCARRSEPA